MKNHNLIDQLNKIAKVDNSWQDDVVYYEKNKIWLDYSAKIAVLILRTLRKNREKNIFPNSQKDLADIMRVSPQQVNKLVKGRENLTIETISRLSEALNISLFNFQTELQTNYKVQTVRTQMDTFVPPLNRFITPSNNGGFINTIVYQTVEEKSQNNLVITGNIQYAMAA